MTIDALTVLRDHYKDVRARLNAGPPPRPPALPAPPPEPPAPPPEPPAPPPPPPPDPMEGVTCPPAIRALLLPIIDAHAMPWAAIIGPRRTLPYVRARAAVYAALRDHGWSYPRIGKLCGRDHTSVMNSLHRYHNRKGTNA